MAVRGHLAHISHDDARKVFYLFFFFFFFTPICRPSPRRLPQDREIHLQLIFLFLSSSLFHVLSHDAETLLVTFECIAFVLPSIIGIIKRLRDQGDLTATINITQGSGQLCINLSVFSSLSFLGDCVKCCCRSVIQLLTHTATPLK